MHPCPGMSKIPVGCQVCTSLLALKDCNKNAQPLVRCGAAVLCACGVIQPFFYADAGADAGAMVHAGVMMHADAGAMMPAWLSVYVVLLSVGSVTS